MAVESSSESRTVFAAVASTIVGLHMLAVTLAAVPTNSFSQAFAPQYGYLSPFFGQSWRLFAPHPIDADRSLLVQGAYVGKDGQIRTTPWVNWTAVELDVIEHRLVGGRAGYITTKLYGRLSQQFFELESGQRGLAERSSALAPPSWSTLRLSLARVGPDDRDLSDYMRYDRAAARLATEVVAARWPSRTFTAVRYAQRSQGVVPYDARHLDSAERKASRPNATTRVGGWRTPTFGPASERRGVADFERRHG